MIETSIREGILASNHHFIAFNKPSGMAVQSLKDKADSLEHKLFVYCKSPLFLIHRIDQPCSGIVLFAKKKPTAAYLNEALQNKTIERNYLALVQNKPEQEAGTLFHHLFAHKKSNKSFVVDEHHKEGKAAQLDYNWLGAMGEFHLLSIRLHTGRHHQIRAQLAAIGSPIKGDIKYGSKSVNANHFIHLHAWIMEFKHPSDHSLVKLMAPLPQEVLWQNANTLLINK